MKHIFTYPFLRIAPLDTRYCNLYKTEPPATWINIKPEIRVAYLFSHIGTPASLVLIYAKPETARRQSCGLRMID